MSQYLEIPKLNGLFPFRSFISHGWDITYPHWHKEIEIIYCLKGRVNLGVYEEIIQLEEGEIYFFPSGEPHFFLASPDSQRIVYQFELKLFHENENLQQKDRTLFELFDTAVNHSRFWPENSEKQLKKLLLSIYEENETKNEGKQYTIMGALYQIVSLFYRLPVKPVQDAKRATQKALKNKETLTYLNTIFEYVEQHYLDPLCLEDISSHLGFSPSYFSRFFKKNVGFSFTQYLTEYRINQAKYILGTEELPMTEVATKSGFASVKTFHHVFKSSVGISPMQFQKQLGGDTKG